MQLGNYGVLLESVKREIAGSRVRAARAVNTELIGMYWRIGDLILDRQVEQGWGTRVIDRLATDLRTSFPDSRGSADATCTTCGHWPKRGRGMCRSLWHNFPGACSCSAGPPR